MDYDRAEAAVCLGQVYIGPDSVSSEKSDYGLNFGHSLKVALESHGITQRELAEKLGVTDQSVSGWTQGTLPGLDNVLKIADLFGISIDKALGRAPAGVEDLVVLQQHFRRVLDALDKLLPAPPNPLTKPEHAPPAN